MQNLTQEIQKLSSADLFKRGTDGGWATGAFVGQPYRLDYDRAHLLIADARKHKAKGLPQGSFLLAYYEGEGDDVREAVLLRVLGLTPLPTERDVIASMVEYYKDNLRTAGLAPDADSELDAFTRFEFSFSGLECRVLGTFYLDADGQTHFGADLENFYSANNYSVVKPSADVLEHIVNTREGGAPVGGPADVKIGRVRYSSARRFADLDESVPVYVQPADFLGKRTALFGMTRTGKSNTVKKVIEATADMSHKAPLTLAASASDPDLFSPLTDEGLPKYPVGQIVFDVNGEYANANLQDEGTAIFELFEDRTTRYSVVPKPGFKVLKVNFYNEVRAGFDLVQNHLRDDGSDYVKNVLAIDFEPPDDDDRSAQTRYDRRVAAYLCCLGRAGFEVPNGFRVRFQGNKDLNALARPDGSLDPSKGVSLSDATDWFQAVWDNYDDAPFFTNYKSSKGKEWADEELKALLVFLTRSKKPGGAPGVSGWVKLRDIRDLHTAESDRSFKTEIVEDLRAGRIVLVDLSQGKPEIQRLYSEDIAKALFANAMARFIDNRPNNFVQFYFEEAHNLFPKRDDKDLAQIYNRLAKEGAKLNLGLIYATQEVSSISSNILKNTQNWFIAHLNNVDETRELEKYYDFGDFTGSLVRFSAANDRGFVRMKTYSNPFVVSVQVDRFLATA